MPDIGSTQRSRRGGAPRAGSATRGFAVTVITAALLVSGQGASQAASRSFGDARGDGAGANDIRRVTVDYARGRLVVSVKIASTSRSGGVTVYVDTVAGRRGPEVVLSGGTSTQGSDWRTARATRRWGVSNNELLCGSRLRVLRASNTIKVTLARGCLTNPDTMNLSTGETTQRRSTDAPRRAIIAVRTNGAHRSVDWARGARTWLPAVCYD